MTWIRGVGCLVNLDRVCEIVLTAGQSPERPNTYQFEVRAYFSSRIRAYLNRNEEDYAVLKAVEWGNDQDAAKRAADLYMTNLLGELG